MDRFPPPQTMEKLEGQKTMATAVIGPAAENGVLFAGILFDGHYAAGRNGLGRVCAAKNIKFITVSGTCKINVADEKALAQAGADIRRLISASPVLMGEFGISRYGTGALYDLTHSRSMMPTDNFNKTRFAPAPRLNAHAFEKKYKPEHTGCRGCHIRCKKISKAKEVLPEFETMNHFTALLNQSDLDLVVKANALCNDLGMDTISAGATLACHSEITGQQLDPAAILSLLKDIGYGKQTGKALGAGAFAYANAMGRPDCAMCVKKLELPAYDPRGAYGMALGYAVASRGGCHLRAYPIATELLRKPVPTDRFSFEGKARIVKMAEDVNAVADSLTACKFVFFGASMEEYAKACSAVTGISLTGRDLLKIGERINYHERIMNCENGFGMDDDDLPERFFNQPGTTVGQIRIPPIPRSDFLNARRNYYRLRGLDDAGQPVTEKAAKLGLSWPR